MVKPPARSDPRIVRPVLEWLPGRKNRLDLTPFDASADRWVRTRGLDDSSDERPRASRACFALPHDSLDSLDRLEDFGNPARVRGGMQWELLAIAADTGPIEFRNEPDKADSGYFG